MAGIVAAISKEPLEIFFDEGLSALCHNEFFCYQTLIKSPCLHLGVVFRENDPVSQAYFPEAGIGVIVYGFAILGGEKPIRVASEQVADIYIKKGIQGVCRLDGGFVVVILDFNRSRFFLINDRTATLPVQYLSENSAVFIAPEAKAIFKMLTRTPTLDIASVWTFLNLGHALGKRTMLDGVSLLEPAQVLEIPLNTAEISISSYWKLTFNPARHLSDRSAANELYRTMIQCHEAALTDRPERVQLLLTGGYDSRAVIGFLSNIGRLPDESLTWGMSDQIEYSDPSVARELADQKNATWRFLYYDGDSFAENAEYWVYVSELSTDNLGSYAAGVNFLYECGPVAPVVLIGDQLLGTAGLPLSRKDAIETVSGIPEDGIAPGLRAILKNGKSFEAGSSVIRQLDELVKACPNDNPKDLQDYLGLHIRVARWLNSPAYFREPMISPRRPMLLSPAIDLFQTFSPNLRVDKRVLVTMLQTKMPEMLRVPKASANSNVDWNRFFCSSDPAGNLFKELLSFSSILESGIGTYFDSQALQNITTSYLTKSRRPMDRTRPPERILTDIRRSASRLFILGQGLRVAELLYHKCFRHGLGASPERVIKRLALVELFQRSLMSGKYWKNTEDDKFKNATIRKIPGCWAISSISGQSDAET